MSTKNSKADELHKFLQFVPSLHKKRFEKIKKHISPHDLLF